MQLNISIDDQNLQEQISNYIAQQKQETNEFVIEAIKQFFKQDEQRNLISKEEINRTVQNSQRIEGYEAASTDVTNKVKTLMKKYNVKVSL